MATTIEKVTKVAKQRGLLAKDGTFKRIDSLALIELISGLEMAFAVSIVPTDLTDARLASIQTLAQFVDELKAPGQAATG